MKYFEVLYKNCFGKQKRALVATIHDTPETATTDFNFNWNGNRLVAYSETTQQDYRSHVFNHYAE